MLRLLDDVKDRSRCRRVLRDESCRVKASSVARLGRSGLRFLGLALWVCAFLAGGDGDLEDLVDMVETDRELDETLLARLTRAAIST